MASVLSAARRARGPTPKSQRLIPMNELGCCNSLYHHKLATFFKVLKDHSHFQVFIILVIFVAGIQVGIATYPVDANGPLQSVLDVLDWVVLIIFIAEIVVKLLAEGSKPWRFFLDGWNCFDFAIVTAGLMPISGGEAVTALRLVRLLRVLKLVRALPKLRVLVMGLLQSMSSIVYIGLLLAMLFYLYAVLGVSMFGTNDPDHMASLHTTLLTLFRCATLEDWSDVMYTAMLGCNKWGYDGNESACVEPSANPVLAVVYFVSFVLLANFMTLNLFIGVITTSMAEAKATMEQELYDEQEAKRKAADIAENGEPDSDDENTRLEELDAAIHVTLGSLQLLVGKAVRGAGNLKNVFNCIQTAASTPHGSSRSQPLFVSTPFTWTPECGEPLPTPGRRFRLADNSQRSTTPMHAFGSMTQSTMSGVLDYSSGNVPSVLVDEPSDVDDDALSAASGMSKAERRGSILAAQLVHTVSHADMDNDNEMGSRFVTNLLQGHRRATGTLEVSYDNHAREVVPLMGNRFRRARPRRSRRSSAYGRAAGITEDPRHVAELLALHTQAVHARNIRSSIHAGDTEARMSINAAEALAAAAVFASHRSASAPSSMDASVRGHVF